MLDCNFIVKEINMFVSFCNKEHFCIHIESTSPADGTSELISESEIEQQEANFYLTELNQDPDQCSEEPKANFAQEGKPQCIIPLFSRYLHLTIHYIKKDVPSDVGSRTVRGLEEVICLSFPHIMQCVEATTHYML